jgi:O-antigen ligase
MIVIGLLALALAVTRTEVVVVLTAVFVWVLLEVVRKNKLPIRRIVIVLLSLIVGMFLTEGIGIAISGSSIWGTTIERFQNLDSEDNLSVVNREVEIREMLLVLPDALITGRGFGNYIPASLGSRGDSNVSVTDQAVWGHNEYLYVLVIMGLPGFLGFLSLLIWILVHAHRIRKSPNSSEIQLVFARAALLLYFGFMVGALTVPRFVRGSGWIGPQILAGVMFTLSYVTRQELIGDLGSRRSLESPAQVSTREDGKRLPALYRGKS